MWRIERYAPDLRHTWDEFVKEGRNSTFLFYRDYMDYHSHRFEDFSLLAYKGERLYAILPAEIAQNEDGGVTLGSHRGLTYGGWILPKHHIDGADVLELFDVWIEYCKHHGITVIDYKPLPYIYAQMPSQEDIYALWRKGGMADGFTLSSAIDLQHNPGFNTLRKRNVKKACSVFPDIECREEISADGVIDFYQLLSDCLDARHNVTPVHTLSEFQDLIRKFPDNIRVFTVSAVGEMLAGVAIYLCGNVAHCQYIATSEKGRETGALALLMQYLITGVFAGMRYFDFGISTEQRGEILNAGLLRQKSGLGGSGVVYPRYRLDI